MSYSFHASNSCPHEQKRAHCPQIDNLTTGIFLEFFLSNRALLSETFVKLMQAAPKPPNDAFETAATICQRAFGDGCSHQTWNMAVARVAKPFCRFAGFERIPAFQYFSQEGVSIGLDKAVWSDALINFHRDVDNKRWLIRLRPALVEALLQLQAITRDRVPTQEDVRSRVLACRCDNITAHVNRMVNLVANRVSSSSKIRTIVSPTRHMDGREQLRSTIISQFSSQLCLCYLCGGLLQFDTDNKLLHPSVDRIESDCDGYDESNIRIAHYACNLAKNEYSVSQFKEWLGIAQNGDSIAYST
jgi:hypothetical protein